MSCISVCYRVEVGPTKGGGGGVNSLLKFYNAKYSIIDDLEHEFKDKKAFLTRVWDKSKIYFGKKSYYLDQFGDRLAKKYSSDSLFLCHDVDSAAEMVSRGRRVLLVYHNQFSCMTDQEMYNKHSRAEQEKLCSLEKLAFLDSDAVAFPSQGACDSYLQKSLLAEHEKEQIRKKTQILYNTCNDFPVRVVPDIADEVREKVTGRTVLLTVSTLYEAKGVDLIPEQLSKIKNFNEKFVWILCGSKGEARQKILDEVKKYGLEDGFIHIDFKMPQAELSFFYGLADYYIMHHRISIFDLATLEAMSFGLIPVLSPVGGNLEVNKEQNVIFMPTSAATDFTLSNDRGEIQRLADLNKKVIKDYFGPEAFLKNYSHFLNDFKEKNNAKI